MINYMSFQKSMIQTKKTCATCLFYYAACRKGCHFDNLNWLRDKKKGCQFDNLNPCSKNLGCHFDNL